jgi:hypothetical protein
MDSNICEKVKKFKKMLIDANKRNEILILKLLNEIKPSIEDSMSESEFDKILLNKIQELTLFASVNLKKKNKSIADQAIYSISLLIHCFFIDKFKLSIENTKVQIVDI